MTPNHQLRPTKTRPVTPALLQYDQSRSEIMNEVRQALYDFGDVQKLAILVEKSPRTLYAIRNGATRWPRWDTLFALLPRLGLVLTVTRTDWENIRRH